MTNQGDDCYFFYYSTCSKGDDCPFRHCEAAMGNETVCNLWEEGCCYRTVCKFRHMEITKNRKEIACYWENQPAGCQKPHCAFFHERPRHIDGVFVPPNKTLNKHEEQQQPEEPVPQPPVPLPTTANPQLRGVLKTETQEPVPSPTHPPVVINPADDDEDEDDQFSEEGEDGKVGLSPRKLHKSGSLNFGVSTLEEIRLRRALKASMKRAGYPLQSAETSTNGEKENIQSLFQPALFQSGDVPTLVFPEAGRPRGSIVERLGRKMPYTDGQSDDAPPLKRSLAERLGRVVDVEHQPTTQQKPLKTVKERLGLSVPDNPLPSVDTGDGPKKFPQQIRIKTLEEIRQEKATKAFSDSQKDAPETTRSCPDKVSKVARRAVTVKDSSIAHVKTFSEILLAKKKRHEEEQIQSTSEKKDKNPVEKNTAMNRQESSDSAKTTQEVTKLRVKTLEEIRREKAARAQNQTNSEGETHNISDSEKDAAKRKRLLRINKQPPHSKVMPDKAPEEKTLPVKPATAVVQTSNNVKVKSFEEIMQEKRLRKQEHESQVTGAAELGAPPSQTPAPSLKRKLPAVVSLASPPSSLAIPTSNSTQKAPIRKLTPLRSLTSTKASDSQPPAAVPVVRRIPLPQPSEAQDKTSGSTAAEASINEAATKTSPQRILDTKVRPKLNVKPSVMKVQVKPGQRKKAAERSAVAAVKPLNSTSSGQEPTQLDTAGTDKQICQLAPAEAQLSSTVPQSSSILLDSTCSPLRDELQTVPIVEQRPRQDAKPAARETVTVPQSPVPKTPSQPKPRRASMATSRSSSSQAIVTAVSSSSATVDDFDMLINEFTDDHLEDEVDPGIGEDDLLQELSEMIDS